MKTATILGSDIAASVPEWKSFQDVTIEELLAVAFPFHSSKSWNGLNIAANDHYITITTDVEEDEPVPCMGCGRCGCNGSCVK